MASPLTIINTDSTFCGLISGWFYDAPDDLTGFCEYGCIFWITSNGKASACQNS